MNTKWCNRPLIAPERETNEDQKRKVEMEGRGREREKCGRPLLLWQDWKVRDWVLCKSITTSPEGWYTGAGCHPAVSGLVSCTPARPGHLSLFFFFLRRFLEIYCKCSFPESCWICMFLSRAACFIFSCISLLSHSENNPVNFTLPNLKIDIWRQVHAGIGYWEARPNAWNTLKGNYTPEFQLNYIYSGI